MAKKTKKKTKPKRKSSSKKKKTTTKKRKKSSHKKSKKTRTKSKTKKTTKKKSKRTTTKKPKLKPGDTLNLDIKETIDQEGISLYKGFVFFVKGAHKDTTIKIIVKKVIDNVCFAEIVEPTIPQMPNPRKNPTHNISKKENQRNQDIEIKEPTSPNQNQDIPDIPDL